MFKRPLGILISLLFFSGPGSICFPAAQADEKAPIVLGQGEQRLLRIPGLERYSIGSHHIHVLPLFKSRESSLRRKDSILIKGVSDGTSDLWVWKQDGSSEHRTIRIEKRSDEPQEIGSHLLERSLGKLEEVEVIFTGKGVVLRGEIQSLAESARIAALLQAYPNEVHDESEISVALLSIGESRILQWLKTSSYNGKLRLERVSQSLWLRGSTENSREQAVIEKQIRSLFPLIQFEIDSFPDHAPTVFFRVFLLELKRSQFRTFGLGWPGQTAGAFKVTTGAIQDLLQIDLALQNLEGKGSAKILSNPELVVRAPGEAELFAGGEIPIQMQSRFYSNVSWKNYGLTLKLKVTQSAGDRVRLDIFTEVSHLDRKVGQTEIPSIQSNRMKTQVDARFGVPLFLSGLLQQGIREEAKGLPFLRSIPILGVLFGSEDYLNERSELVAILYPHSSPPTPPRGLPTLLEPRGNIPPPREWVSPQQMRELQESQEYPWNALQ